MNKAVGVEHNYILFLEERNRRQQMAARIAVNYLYSFGDILPLVTIVQDEALIREVLDRYLEYPDGLALARHTLYGLTYQALPEG